MASSRLSYGKNPCHPTSEVAGNETVCTSMGQCLNPGAWSCFVFKKIKCIKIVNCHHKVQSTLTGETVQTNTLTGQESPEWTFSPQLEDS